MTPWTDHEDRFLIFHGRCLAEAFAQADGYEFVGLHDLQREDGEATARIAWLREHQPELVRQLEAEADLEAG